MTTDKEEQFLIAHVSRDGRVIGVDHPSTAPWEDVLAAHVMLRDHLNDRITRQRACPFHKNKIPPNIQNAG